MSNPMFNGSGCKDPTAYQAINEVENEKKREKKALEKDIKGLLDQYNYACRNIAVMREEIKQLGQAIKSERDTSKAIQIREESIQSSGKISDPTADAVARIIDKYEKQIEYMSDRIDQLYEVKNKVDELLGAMTESQREVITLLHIKKYRWYQACQKLHLSKSSLYRIQDEGISIGCQLLKSQVKNGHLVKVGKK